MNLIEELVQLIKESGLKVTFDPDRDNTKPCIICKIPANKYHELIDIGTYSNGEKITRPMCENCIKNKDK